MKRRATRHRGNTVLLIRVLSVRSGAAPQRRAVLAL